MQRRISIASVIEERAHIGAAVVAHHEVRCTKAKLVLIERACIGFNHGGAIRVCHRACAMFAAEGAVAFADRQVGCRGSALECEAQFAAMAAAFEFLHSEGCHFGSWTLRNAKAVPLIKKGPARCCATGP